MRNKKEVVEKMVHIEKYWKSSQDTVVLKSLSIIITADPHHPIYWNSTIDLC